MTDVMPEQAVDLDEVVYGEAADPAAGLDAWTSSWPHSWPDALAPAGCS